MNLPPVFEVRGRSITNTILYALLGSIILIVLIYLYFTTYESEYGVLRTSMGPFFIILFVLAACLCYFAAYVAFIPKKLVFDGQYLYLYHGKSLKRKILFRNVIRVGSGSYRVKMAKVNLIFIKYLQNRRKRTLEMTEDEFTVPELKTMLRELARFSIHYNFTVEDRNRWLI